MNLSNCFQSKLTEKKSQAKGLRDPECGCSLSPLVLLRHREGIETEDKGF